MNLALKAIMRSNRYRLRIAVIALMISIPVILFTTSDYLTLNELNNIENTLDFVMTVPGQDDLAQFQSSVANIDNHEYIESVFEMMVVVVPELIVSSGSDILGNGCIFVGISDQDELFSSSPGISAGLAQRENITMGDNLVIWDNTQADVNRTVSINSVITLTTQEEEVIQSTSNLFIDRTYDEIQIFGNLTYIFNLTKTLLQEVGLSPAHSTRLVVWGNLQEGITYGNPNLVTTRLKTITEDVYNNLSILGSVFVIESPLTRVNEIQEVYTRLEQSLLIVVIPTVIASLIVTYTILWVSLEINSNRMKTLRVRGLTEKSLQKYIVLDGFVVGVSSGVIGVFLSVFLSAIIFSSITNQFLNWLQFLLQSPLLMIGLAMILGVTTSIFSNLLTIKSSSMGEETVKTSRIHPLGLLGCVLSLIDLSLGLPVLRGLQYFSISMSGSILAVTLTAALLIETIFILGSPLIFPITFSKIFPRFMFAVRRFFRTIIQIPELVMKSFSAPSRRTSRLILLTLIISFLITPPFTLHATISQMNTTDSQLSLGGQIRVEVQGLNANVCRTDIKSAISSIPNIHRISWGTKLQVQTGLSLLLHDTDLILVDDDYFDLKIVEDYVEKTNDGIMLSLSCAEQELVQDKIEVKIGDVQIRVNKSGSFAFLPGFQDSTFMFQEVTPYAFALASFIEDYFGNITYSYSSILLIETTSTFDLNEIGINIENVLEGFVSGTGAYFKIETPSNTEVSEGIESSFSLISGVYLMVTGILAILFIVVFNLRNSTATLILLAYRGANRKQLVRGSLLEHISVFAVPLLLGLIISLIYVYGVTFVPIIITSSISVLPKGYFLVIPSSIILVYTLILSVIIIFVYLSVRKQVQSTAEIRHREMIG